VASVRLEDLEPGLVVNGIVPGERVSLIKVDFHGSDAATVTFDMDNGDIRRQVIYRASEDELTLATGARRSFDAQADEFKLAAEAQRIQLAGLFDPMLAVATSDVRPLPHQIRAVYGELLPRSPLRFLLADDPGAGKTIMAGLYIKELLLRDDVKRALIVAPGGLVDQWQEELYLKFGLRFEVLTNQLADSTLGANVFESHPLLIARMDHLTRNEFLREQLATSEWDLVVVDEAHRMGARWFGGKLDKTQRFQLGEELGTLTRHLLLMTATPHSGKEEDFQAFLTLLDRDAFVGKGDSKRRRPDTKGLMRRMVKEDLLTFEGKPLFPDRTAQTVPYELTALEQELYEQVTDYVRDGMGRADQLDGKRRATVGFALTVLQRRLASSPAAIHESLKRRIARLSNRERDLVNGVAVDTNPTAALVLDADDDEIDAEQLEAAEDELVDSATAARTAEELRLEIAQLEELSVLAARVRAAGSDVKWSELRTILQDNVLEAPSGSTRKLIVFTEHRDTLDYLVGRIRSLLGQPEAVEAMHGGVRRAERHRIAEEFTKNPTCRVLVATDAAGEGLNLQAAHLMVNYDLPWNPNRIEQRFGRIHRIGQTEVCRLWNLVAINTREGLVFETLLAKIEEQRAAYDGKVFDVLGGGAFDKQPLRTLLIEAIRDGERPEVRARMERVIDETVSEGLVELMQERALAADAMPESDVQAMRRAMDEARARRLQPHFIAQAFRAILERLGGRMARREKDRFEITRVPESLRGRRKAIASRYERVTFELSGIEGPGGDGAGASVRADLLAPGHPLHDAVMTAAVERWGDALERGTVLIAPDLDEPRLLIGVKHEVVDGTAQSIGRRFGYAYAAQSGLVEPAPSAPYLDAVAVTDERLLEWARSLDWIESAERAAVDWLIGHELPEYLAEVTPRRRRDLERTRAAVTDRLNSEVRRLGSEALTATHREQQGQVVKESSASLVRRAHELESRLERRLADIERQSSMSTPPPRVTAAAIVIPARWLDDLDPAAPAAGEEADLPMVPTHAVETKAVERRGVDAVIAAERALGRAPEEQASNNKGFDIRSVAPDGSSLIIEVKARIEGAEDFHITHSEVMAAKNSVPNYRLALVRVDPRGPEHDEIRYLQDPAGAYDSGSLFTAYLTLDWRKTWDAGSLPF
jgi:superfamily II DNA or RNA helicase